MSLEAVPYGDHAVLVRVPAGAGFDAAARLGQLIRDVSAADELPAPMDVVPAAASVLVAGLPGASAVARWRARLALVDLDRAAEPGALTHAAITEDDEPIVLETTYDGPDLDSVAEVWGCAAEEVARRHQDIEFVVAFCGFAPGFGYCVPLGDPLPPMRRRNRPRERVPAGSVALAGEYCGVYPRDMPGGWQLIGRTELALFNPAADQPALLAPGRRVRFREAGAVDVNAAEAGRP